MSGRDPIDVLTLPRSKHRRRAMRLVDHWDIVRRGAYETSRRRKPDNKAHVDFCVRNGLM
jgi:hypothetical protein